MAKINVSDENYRSWNEVDDALMRIREAQIAISERENERDRVKVEADERCKRATDGLRESVKDTAKLVKAFVGAHKGDLTGKQRVLTFGVVGYRSSTKMRLPPFEKDELIDALRAAGLSDCIIETEPRVSLEILRTKKPEQLKAIGGWFDVQDAFYLDAGDGKKGAS